LKTSQSERVSRHGIVDIPAFSVGQVLRALTADDDPLGEMLENRQRYA